MRIRLALTLAVLLAAMGGLSASSLDASGALAATNGKFTDCFYCDDDCCKIHDGPGAMACSSGVSYPNCGSWCSIEDQTRCPATFDLSFGADGVAMERVNSSLEVGRNESHDASEARVYRTCDGVLLGRYYEPVFASHLDRLLGRIAL